MDRELKVLTEQEQKRATGINALIARGVMPPMDELRARRNVLGCGCPEQLLRSVVEKNASIARGVIPPVPKPVFRNKVSVARVYADSLARCDMERRKRLLAEILAD
jgi:hypothetical protein